MTMSWDNMALFEMDPTKFLKRFLTEDECWVYRLELDTERQFMQWTYPFLPLPKKAKLVSSAE